MIIKKDKTPQLIVANSPHLLERTVLDFILQDDELAAMSVPHQYVADMLREELRTMTLSDSSAVFANENEPALKKMIKQIARRPDPPIGRSFDSYDPWFDEPLWKEQYDPITGLISYLNTQTDEILSGDELQKRNKANQICQESIQFLPREVRILHWKSTLKRLTIQAFQRYYKICRLWFSLPWNRQKTSSLNANRKDIPPVLQNRLCTMLQHSKYNSFEWLLGALVDALVVCNIWQNLSEKYHYQFILVGSCWSDATAICWLKREVYAIVVEIAYEMSDEKEKAEHSLSYYKEKYKWLLTM